LLYIISYHKIKFEKAKKTIKLVTKQSNNKSITNSRDD